MITVPFLSYDRPVRQDLVHKTASAEVFPTDLVAAGADELWAGVQWPTEHSFYVEPPDGVDSYLLLETIRQLTILACHEHYSVPAGAHFIMSGLGSTTVPGVTGSDRAGGHRRIVAHLRATRVRRSASGALQGLRLEIDFSSSAGVFASGHGDAMIVDDRVYSRIRGGRTDVVPAPPRLAAPVVDPRAVGHLGEGDVLLAESAAPDAFTLSIDFGNRVLFDHPLDHIAGMIPVEATRQMMRIHLGDNAREFVTAEFRFHNALEFGAPVLTSLTRSERGMRAAFEQGGRLAVSAEFTS